MLVCALLFRAWGDGLADENGAAQTAETRRFAVLLNDNAKKVTEEVREELAALVAPDDLFFSKSIEDANRITETLVRRRYPVVFTGGGDGTVVDFIDRITRVGEALPDFPIPNIGILRLGTGNALAEMVSSGSFESDIKAYIANGFRDLRKLALIEAEGRRFPFAGLGWDAEILNDYSNLRTTHGERPVIGKAVQNVAGYFGAFFLKTFPRILGRTVRRKKLHVTVTNLGERATRIGAGGVVRTVYGPGEVLYEGPVGIAMVGTAPFYGFGLKVLPYAGVTPNAMHLRLASFPVTTAVGNLPALWRGAFEHDELRDYFATHVLLQFNEDMPFQIGGDAEGWRREAEFELSKASVQLVRFI